MRTSVALEFSERISVWLSESPWNSYSSTVDLARDGHPGFSSKKQMRRVQNCKYFAPTTQHV